MNVLFPSAPEELPADGEFLAGGTDLGERIRSGAPPERLVDLSRMPLSRTVDVDDAGLRIGALATVADVGAHTEVRRRYGALSEICRVIATPQIRNRATMGGALCQRTRCWYFRHHGFSCFKSGGSGCPARGGNNLYGVAFDLGPCVYPHPSSVALALLAYDGVVDTTRRAGVGPDALFGDGSDPTRDHHLAPGELLTDVWFPAPGEAERSAYVRLMARVWAEWPLVECVVRLRESEGVFSLARVAVGGVANVPLRLAGVERRLLGSAPVASSLDEAARAAADGASVPPGAQDKRVMLVRTVLEALETALSATPGG